MTWGVGPGRSAADPSGRADLRLVDPAAAPESVGVWRRNGLEGRWDVGLVVGFHHPGGHNVKPVKLLTKHRHRLLTFLYVEGVQPTNNAAERALRPAVIVHKISAHLAAPG